MPSNNVYLPRPLLCLLHLTYFRKWCHVFTKSLIGAKQHCADIVCCINFLPHFVFNWTIKQSYVDYTNNLKNRTTFLPPIKQHQGTEGWLDWAVKMPCQ